jgi:hypothetical protein
MLSARGLLFTAVCLLPVGTSAAAQEKAGASYEALLAKVKKADPAVDFTRLRLAYTESPGYNPYGSDRKLRQQMRDALADKDYAKAAELAAKVLGSNYVDLEAHSVAHRAYRELKDTKRADLHRYALDGLIKSILKSGDGKSPKTAFMVICTDEEYAILGALGIRRTQQALVGEGGQRYDRLDGIHQETGNRVTLYFNVTRQFDWLKRQFEKRK